jgi:cystathionine beta-lyase
LHAAIDRGDTAYFSIAAERASAEAASSFWADRIGWTVSSDQVFHAPDVVEGVRRAIVYLTKPDSPVVLHTPAYFPFFSAVERANRPLIEVPCVTDEDGRHRLDIERIESAFLAGAGSLILCNPWNPVGRAFTRAELEEVTALARRHGARVISDEIHAPLTASGHTHVPTASVDAETVITVTSASKAWNLPGLKCAQVFLTNPSDVKFWSGYFEHYKIGVSNLGLIANAAAFSDGRKWLDDVKQVLEANRSLLGQLLESHIPDVGYVEPEATYLAWLDFASYGLREPAAFLLAEAKVALTEGEPFRGDSSSFARLNFATTPEILTEVVERIAAALSRL